VDLDRLLGGTQLRAHLLVEPSGHDEPKHLPLAGRERVEAAPQGREVRSTGLVLAVPFERASDGGEQGFKTYIVSGGGVEFMRAWAEKAYGIPPEQVVGSSGVTKYELRPSGPVLVKEAKLEFIDDGPGKPAGINRFIGRRPILAFGNSDGDQQMLQWTAAGAGVRFVGLVHHTDADREWAYDRQSSIGKLDKALDEAHAEGWTVVDMKQDWKRIYPFDK
jgi:hypothetical protein